MTPRLSRRKDDVRKIWKEFVNNLEPLDSLLKERGGFPENFNRHLWDDLVFNTAIHAYTQALNCYHYNQLEASMAMCRTAIDSAIYLGITQVREESITSHSFREISPELRKKVWRWNNLERFGKQFGLLDDKTLEMVRKVRKVGSFSAHLATSQDLEFRDFNDRHQDDFKKWYEDMEKAAQGKKSLNWEEMVSVFQTAPPPPVFEDVPRRWTIPEEGWIVLRVTGYCLATIIIRYFVNEATMSKAPLK